VLSDSIAAIGLFVAFIIGHSTFMLTRYSDGFIAKAVYYVLPSLYNTDIKTEVGAGIDVPTEVLLYGAGYGLCYAIAMVGLSTLIFSRKDIS
jgi:ABC-type transport system involved in multi-copper enzyme maturation permease subunit